jgi:hypothetical protein
MFAFKLFMQINYVPLLPQLGLKFVATVFFGPPALYRQMHFFYVCFNILFGVYAGMNTERIQPFLIFFILQKKKW